MCQFVTFHNKTVEKILTKFGKEVVGSEAIVVTFPDYRVATKK